MLTEQELTTIEEEFHKARHSAAQLEVWSYRYGRNLIETCREFLAQQTEVSAGPLGAPPSPDRLLELDAKVASVVMRMDRCDKFLCLPEDNCRAAIHGVCVEWPYRGHRWRPTVDAELRMPIVDMLEKRFLRRAFITRLPHWLEADMPEFCQAAVEVVLAAEPKRNDPGSGS